LPNSLKSPGPGEDCRHEDAMSIRRAPQYPPYGGAVKFTSEKLAGFDSRAIMPVDRSPRSPKRRRGRHIPRARQAAEGGGGGGVINYNGPALPCQRRPSISARTGSTPLGSPTHGRPNLSVTPCLACVAPDILVKNYRFFQWNLRSKALTIIAAGIVTAMPPIGRAGSKIRDLSTASAC